MAVGSEWVRHEEGDPSGIGKRTTDFGVSLPVGVEFLRSHNTAEQTGKAGCFVCRYGLFIPLVDLGALLSYRVGGSDSVHAEPNATFRQVFAPGMYMSLALTRTVPATLLLGGQLMPALRTVDNASGPAPRSAWRVGASLGLDVMLLHF